MKFVKKKTKHCKHAFRKTRDKDGQIPDGEFVLFADFELAMTRDAAGHIAWEGEEYRYCHNHGLNDGLSSRPPASNPNASLTPEKKIISDTLGVPDNSLEEYRDDAASHGFSGLEFKEDPQVSGFFQAHFSSKAEWNRYLKHRGLVDRSSRNGGGEPLTEKHLERAKQAVLEKYGPIR